MTADSMYVCIQCNEKLKESELVMMPRENAPGQLVWMETACPHCGGLCIPSYEFRKVLFADELNRMRMRDIDTMVPEDRQRALPKSCIGCQFSDVLFGKSVASISCRHPRCEDVSLAEFVDEEEFFKADDDGRIFFECPLDEYMDDKKKE